MNAVCATVSSAQMPAAGSGGSGVHSPDLSIICVNWNSLQYLIDCLESIYANPPDAPFEIIVVDNASPEGGAKSLVERFPAVHLFQSEKNLGFAAANNLAFRHSRGQYILLLNPDTSVVGSALTLMLEGMRTLPDAGIVGCTLLNSDGSVSTSSIQKFPTILNQLLTAEWLRLRFPGLSLWNIAPLFSEKHTPLKVDVIPGACMMLRRDVFERVGMLTEDYFMYAEDIDLNLKVRKLGLSSYYLGEARIVHYGGRSSMQQPVSHWSLVMMQRAMLRFFQINHGPLYAAAYRAMIGFSAVSRLALLYGALPFGPGQQNRWAIAKWRLLLKWALGLERLESTQ